MSSGINRRVLCAGMAGAAVSAFASGCGDPLSQKPDPVEKPQIKIGLVPIPQVAPLFIAQSLGYFKAEGLNAQFVKLPGSNQALDQVLKGQLDFAQSTAASALRTQQETNAVRFVTEVDVGTEGYPIVVTGDSPIRRPEDLRGKVIAVNERNNLPEIACVVHLRIHGLDIKADKIKFVAVPLPKALPTLLAKKVDAAFLLDPFLLQAEAKGCQRVLELITGPTAQFPLTQNITSAKFINENPKTAQAFKRAVLRAQQRAANDRALVVKTVSQLTGISQQQVALLTLPTFVTSTNPIRLARAVDLMHRNGFLKKRIDIKEMIPGSLQ